MTDVTSNLKHLLSFLRRISKYLHTRPNLYGWLGQFLPTQNQNIKRKMTQYHT